MRYLVPQFVERSIKVVGPLDFKQFIFFIGGGVVCLIAYAFLYHTHFMLFLLVCMLSFAGSVSLAFVKYHGVPLPELIVNFFSYSIGGKKYLWEKKAIVAQVYQMPEMKEPEKKKELPVQRGSRLENLSTRIDIER